MGVSLILSAIAIILLLINQNLEKLNKSIQAKQEPKLQPPKPTYIDCSEPFTYILSKPKNGWSGFDLYHFHGSLSYIDDVPNIILNAILNYQDNNECIMSFNEEGSDFHVIVKPHITFIIHEGEQPTLYAYDIHADRILNTLYNDLQEDIDYWSAFHILYEADEKEDYELELQKNRTEIEEKLQLIRQTKVKSYGQHTIYETD